MKFKNQQEIWSVTNKRTDRRMLPNLLPACYTVDKKYDENIVQMLTANKSVYFTGVRPN